MVGLSDEALSRMVNCRGNAWATWEPRPDAPADFDQQTAFIKARDIVSFALGGNASGKTAAGARKLVEFVLTTQPPRKDSPFYIAAENYQQCCATIWAEKLDGAGFLPEWEVDRARIVWLKPTQNWPLIVPLKPWANGNNWTLEFKSYEQGREAMQARSICGFWLSEMFAWPIFLEILRGCRDTLLPGGQFAEFTPINPDLAVAIEKIQDKPPKGWGIYRLNTARNKPNLAPEWFDSFFASVPKTMLATRMTGALATFQGAIFPSFNVHTHVEPKAAKIPPAGTHHRGIDWGFSEQHPFACTWGHWDGAGEIRIYAEYWSPETKTARAHSKHILAISLALGWPVPEEILRPRRENTDFAREVIELADRLNPKRPGREIDPQTRLPCFRPGEYGQTYADSSRPDCILQFNQVGIYTTGGTHEVLRGIEEMQGLMEINPATNKPHLMVSEHCPHLIEELRKYRWKTRDDDGVKAHEPFKLAPFMKGEDTVCSARYMCYSVQKSRGATIDTAVHRPATPESMSRQFSQHETTAGGSVAKRMMSGQFR